MAENIDSQYGFRLFRNLSFHIFWIDSVCIRIYVFSFRASYPQLRDARQIATADVFRIYVEIDIHSLSDCITS